MPHFRLTRTPRLRPELPPVDDPDLPAPSARTLSPASIDERHHVDDARPVDDARLDDAHHGDDTPQRIAQGVRVIDRDGG